MDLHTELNQNSKNKSVLSPMAQPLASGATKARSSAPKRAESNDDDDRTSLSPAALRRAFMDHLHFSLGKTAENATDQDKLTAVCLMVRDRLVQRWVETERTHSEQNVKRAYYLSAEFLLGRALENNLINLEIYKEVESILGDLGIPLVDILETEADAGLGNGGLGRLAACFMDSMATLGIPAIGYGIRYKYGIFEQEIRNGFQVERPEHWLKHGTPWEFIRQERTVDVNFYGRSEMFRDETGALRFRWTEGERMVGVPHDRLVAGYTSGTVNTLRLWRAQAVEGFDLVSFNDGHYARSVEKKNDAAVISKVLYPNDKTDRGRELRLKQQYFFVRCSLVDIMRRHFEQGNTIDTLPEKAAVQLNDTHPSIAVAELMRILVDEQNLGWEAAWDLTRRTISFTNHTVMAEALEKWPVSLIGRILPRHMEIIFEINRRFLEEVSARWPGDTARLGRMSLIEEGGEKRVRMANLAIVGSHTVNGVAALHTELLKKDVFRDFFEMTPQKFLNVTNGVTPARWLIHCNPKLSEMLTRYIGDEWKHDLSKLQKLEAFADSTEVQHEVREIKRANKVALARYFKQTVGITLNPDSIYDMQIKRIHEYKRQLLNILHAASLYVKVKRDPNAVRVPRTFMIGGKAASAYDTAKTIIKLANSVGSKIQEDPVVREKVALHFIPNYRVSVAEKMIPACDVSEQISTAGTEASGTSNMKLALNGALTIGTLDGANIEIREAAGAENFFLFGMDIDEVEKTYREGSYSPAEVLAKNPELREVIELIESGYFCPEQPDLFKGLMENLRTVDFYRVLGDFAAYADAHERIEQTYLDQRKWTRMAIVNIAKMGRFSSNRSIQEYAEKIWKTPAVEVRTPQKLSRLPS